MRNASGRRQLAKVRKPRAKSATTKPRQGRRKPVVHRRLWRLLADRGVAAL